MLSKDSRLRVTEIACRMKLGREVTLTERIWMHKLIKANKIQRNTAQAQKMIFTYRDDLKDWNS